MRLRQMAVAFLFNEAQDVLFLQKRPAAVFSAGIWFPLGATLRTRHNDPRIACLREIIEETGLTGQNIGGLTLRYMIYRLRAGQEISVQYIYMGIVAPGSRLASGEEGNCCGWKPASLVACRSRRQHARCCSIILNQEYITITFIPVRCTRCREYLW